MVLNTIFLFSIFFGNKVTPQFLITNEIIISVLEFFLVTDLEIEKI